MYNLASTQTSYRISECNCIEGGQLVLMSRLVNFLCCELIGGCQAQLSGIEPEAWLGSGNVCIC